MPIALQSHVNGMSSTQMEELFQINGIKKKLQSQKQQFEEEMKDLLTKEGTFRNVQQQAVY